MAQAGLESLTENTECLAGALLPETGKEDSKTLCVMVPMMVPMRGAAAWTMCFVMMGGNDACT